MDLHTLISLLVALLVPLWLVVEQLLARSLLGPCRPARRQGEAASVSTKLSVATPRASAPTDAA